MPIELKIPQVGESIAEVQIADWLKNEGDVVAKDETIAVIDSEKATFDLPSPVSGTLAKRLRQQGDTVKVGETIGQIEPGGPAEKPGAPASRAGTENPPAPAKTEQEEPPAGTAEKKGKADAAEETKEVVPDEPARPVESKSTVAAGRNERTVPMSMFRRTAARRLVEAKQQMALLTTFNEVDLSAVQALRHEYQEAFEKRHQTRLGLMSFFVKAAVDALKRFPQVNARIDGDNIVYRDYIDISIAIAGERGLVVPVLRDVERMSFAEIEKTIADLAKRAKDARLRPEELADGTFTITNGGVFGSLWSTPIINPPQSGILGMHAIQERPVAVQGQIVIRPMMYVALTYDHRVVDGREAVLFLQRIKEIVEKPARLLIGI